ncbi:hypothetical protein ACFWXK_11040 [Streptomyces sp. NPDC059070]|uniref:hypothetical protein n=1 Tax=Streptomyces sp. NPDC059070 TaxID=3346713 RepID=UPI0036AB631B
MADALDEADEHTVFALEHAATSLALELAHLRGVAEVELRLRRELVDDLLTATDPANAYARSEAVGHDLHRSHHVVVWSGRTGPRTTHSPRPWAGRPPPPACVRC